MTIGRHLSQSDLKLTTRRNLTSTQKAKWDAAYGPKNQAFTEANLQGDALLKWKYQRYVKDYLRCVDSVDENIGRLLDYLEESGLAENTVVIYSSDQGWYLGEHGWYDKRWMYEESFRTPLIIRWPDVTPASSENADLVQNLDYAQTFLDICGVQSPKNMQGASITPTLHGKKPKY
jgi:arylsulfatase A-like enzyme